MGNGDHNRRSNQGDQQLRSHDPKDDSGNERYDQATWPWRRVHVNSDSGDVRWDGCMEFEEGSDGGSDGGESLVRMRSLMGDDLKELKGCLDLGFGFNYDEIPGLCAMLPALELFYSMSRLLGCGAGNAGGDADESYEAISTLLVANWKISRLVMILIGLLDALPLVSNDSTARSALWSIL
ncbi:hypothetical protein ZIOFF_070480 [Zingiber officinale]|uniref:Uncharacterized protein n=1 Tax=Zingiber officinale TaxID=94328 RepID=A0A8J5CU28_ZINOF|nr:hypothetical protein ZIOFF_070480 [Zingiber officinale]